MPEELLCLVWHLAEQSGEFHTGCSIKPLISVWAGEKTSRADTKTLQHLQVVPCGALLEVHILSQ